MNQPEMNERQSRPTEQEIIIWLETADVPLSDEYQRRMAVQPWLAHDAKETKLMEKQITTRRQSLRRLALGFTLVALAVALMLAFTPAGRTLAQNVYRYFVPVSDLPTRQQIETEPVIIEGDEVTIPEGSNVTVETAENEDGSTLITAEDADGDPVAIQIETDNGSALITEGDGSLEVTVTETEDGLTTSSSSGGGGGGGGGIAPPMPDLTVERATELVEFAVKEIGELPDGYQLESIFTPLAMPDQPTDIPALHFVSLTYNDGTDTIQLMQNKLFEGETVGGQVVGDEAEVQSVDLGEGVTAEYVRGQWIMPETVAPGTDPFAQATWDSDAPDQRLTWTADNVHFELFTTSPDLTLEDLLAMVASLQ
jgi:hypothetical protein